MRLFSKYIAYVKDNPEQYWFKRKLFGWGWVPVRWQGWVVIVGSVLLILMNARRLGGIDAQRESIDTALFIQTAGIIAVMILICYVKGERPRWQWGFPKEEKETE